MASKKEIEVNLIQSFKVEVKSDTKISNVINDDSFQATLHDKTPFNRQLSDNPTFSPKHLEGNDLTNDLEKVNYSMREASNQPISPFMRISSGLISLGFDFKKDSDNFNDQFSAIVAKEVKKETSQLSEKLDLTNASLALINQKLESHSPKIVRQLIKELRIRAINSEYKIQLKEDDPIYANNYDLFESKYSNYCDEMFKKYKDDTTNHFLRSLFTFKLSGLNSLMHESTANYTIEEVKEEVERCLLVPIEEAPTHPLAKFFEKWMEARVNESNMASGDHN
jgi:hypothetical protein